MRSDVSAIGDTVAPRTAAVLVHGDLGRSPRMLYHAQALANSGTQVELVGYRGRELPTAIAQHPNIRVYYLAPPWRHGAEGAKYAAAAFADIARQTGELVWMLRKLRSLDVVLVQTPPALPSLPLAYLWARSKGARLVVDWHNFAADMVALRQGPRHPFVHLMGALESAFGRRADAHLCVSRAMQTELARRFGIRNVSVFYDRPRAAVKALSQAEQAALFHRLGLDLAEAELRPPVVVSCSSWSADEDFGLLLEAMQRLDARRFACVFLLTGDGPMRRAWEEQAERAALCHVRYRTLWVPAEDYFALLSSADLGVSLHRSASGFDLPMKICDMKSAGLPLLALDYGPVLAEFVKPGENGFLFGSADELAEQIVELFAPHPGRSGKLERVRKAVERERADDWAEGWKREAQGVFT